MIECECERWRDGTTVCPMHGTVKPAAPIVPAAMLTVATALAELLCSFDIIEAPGADGFTPQVVMRHRHCGWKSTPLVGGGLHYCLALQVDDAIEHLGAHK